MLKGLLDLGCTTSTVLQQHANKLTRGCKPKYATYGGTTTTSYSTKLQLKLNSLLPIESTSNAMWTPAPPKAPMTSS